jgi:hypothetical protein
VLYSEVYAPITVAWFGELGRCNRRHTLLAEAPRYSLVRNLNELDKLIHELVDKSLVTLHGKLDDMLAVVREHRDWVLWEGQMVPASYTDDEQVKNALSHKLKRNISMGAVEIVICLEGAAAYGKERLGLKGEQLVAVLKRSGQLGGSLALLHDEQEQQRLQTLTGEPGYLKYPEVDFADVIVGRRYHIPLDMFVAVGSGAKLKLRFAANRVDQGPFKDETPIERCPAYHHSRHDRTEPLSEDLWHLIVDIYHGSGRLD